MISDSKTDNAGGGDDASVSRMDASDRATNQGFSLPQIQVGVKEQHNKTERHNS